MLKSIVFAGLMTFSTLSFADISIEQTEANFNTCMEQDPSWFYRWGQYVISFDKKDAGKICGPSLTKSTGCNVDKQWLHAGFYCGSSY